MEDEGHPRDKKAVSEQARQGLRDSWALNGFRDSQVAHSGLKEGWGIRVGS